MNARPHVVLTISRQLGSGGSVVGREVARRTGVKYVDREILQEAAALLGASPDEIEGVEERAASVWTRIASMCAIGPPEGPYAPPPMPIREDEVFRIQSRIIREIASREDAVIVGRGAAHVLRDHPGVIRVFLHAPDAWRVRRVMETYHVADAAEARQIVERSDRERSRFVQALQGGNWTDSCAYDVCFDTSAVGLEQTTDILAALLRSRLGP